MSDWFADDKTVKVRKQQRCEACGHTIDPGETSIYQRGRFDGDFFARHLHPVCKDIWFESQGDDEYLGDFWEELRHWLETHLGEMEGQLCYYAATDYFRATRPKPKVYPPCEWCQTTHGGCCCKRQTASCAVCGDRCLPLETKPDLCGFVCWVDYQEGKRCT